MAFSILTKGLYAIIFMIMSHTSCFSQSPSLPAGFVFLTDVAPTIKESVRYFGDENFLGAPVAGYTKNRIICTAEAAHQLKKAQEDFVKQGFCLVVYDGYRPQRAVDAFMRWSKDENDQVSKEKYYPTIEKKDVFKLGYVAEKSGHSRGSTFDVTLIPLNMSLKPVTIEMRTLTNGEEIPFLNDNTVDMGSSFDLFHEVSHHDTPLISETYSQRRQLLREIMAKNGFKEYHEEWWHYTLDDEPYHERYFDFTA